MKKLAIASVLALAAVSASALDLGVNATHTNYNDKNGFGVSVGQKFGKFGVTAGFEQFATPENNQDRYSLIGSYDVVTVGPVTVSARAGGALLRNYTADTGYVGLYGVGASMPLTKKISADVSLLRQQGQSQVTQFDGNLVSAGLKYSF